MTAIITISPTNFVAMFRGEPSPLDFRTRAAALAWIQCCKRAAR